MFPQIEMSGRLHLQSSGILFQKFSCRDNFFEFFDLEIVNLIVFIFFLVRARPECYNLTYSKTKLSLFWTIKSPSEKFSHCETELLYSLGILKYSFLDKTGEKHGIWTLKA